MPTIQIPLSTVNILEAAPTRAFGQPAQVQVGTGARLLLAASVAQIPSTAIVQSAAVVLRSTSALSGSRTLSAYANTQGWTAQTTWSGPNGQPMSSSTAAGSATVSNAVAGSTWVIPVTSTVQSWVSRSLTNNGLKVGGDAGPYGLFAGAAASSGKPYLTVTYATTAPVPSNLRPQGAAVSLAKPTLTADVGSATQSIQVQVDASANATTPAFDSGEVATTGGLLDLSATSYAGLTDGATTQWRIRAKNALGWSDWSPWASFSRKAWKAFTVTSPGSTSEDPSPTAAGTYAGTLTAWRVLFLNSAGVQVSDSGWQSGSAPSFTSTGSVGASGVARFQLRDDTARTATPGDPDYLQVDKAFTVTPSGTPTAPSSVQVVKPLAASPIVQVTVQRAAIPDEVVVYRNDVQVARLKGSDVFTGSGPYTASVTDCTAPMNVPATYSVRAVVNGAFSNAAAAATFVPTCSGIWLLDPDTGTGVAVWTGEDQDQAQPELSALSRPIGGSGAVVRRRLARGPREGSVSGQLIAAVGADNGETLLRSWTDGQTGYDAGHIFRLVLGNLNDPVIIGDTTFREVPANMTGQRVLGASFNWWWQG